jgi:cysteine-rich repeat protein
MSRGLFLNSPTHVFLRLSLCLLALTAATVAAPRWATAQICSQMWDPITVSPSSVMVGTLSNYAISTHVPNSAGCAMNTLTVISITLPADTLADTITTGTLNGSPISFLTKNAQAVSFASPVAVAIGGAVTIVLNGVTNPTMSGGVTLSMSALPTALGAIPATTSATYVISLATATPTRTNTLTHTPTNTNTPVATPTNTPANTSTPTNTPTPTVGLCTTGIGMNPCIPAGGSATTNCQLEFATTPVPPANSKGLPKNRLICYEGDPDCDADPVLNNDSCAIRVRMCINNQDPRLPVCAPGQVNTAEVKSPNPLRPRDAADTANVQTLESALGPGGLGLTVMRRDVQLSAGAPNSTPNACTESLDIEVPLRVRNGRRGAGSRRLGVKTFSATGTAVSDRLGLKCRPSTCGDGVIQTSHENCDDGNRLNGDGCNQACKIELVPPPTPTLAVPTATATSSPTQTPAGPPTATATATNTPTVTATFVTGPGVCGNGVVEIPEEECDDGGTCAGGANAGTFCTGDSECVGDGVCVGGTNVGKGCGSDPDCPGGGTCVRCKTFGGDGCAANCTEETDVAYNLVPGRQSNGLVPGTSGATVRSSVLTLTLLLNGSETLTVGKERNGQIPFVVKQESVNLPRVAVSSLACACPRAIVPKTCGGVLFFESDGVTPATNCTPEFTAGDSVCTDAGKAPCAFAIGAGNSAQGVIGCSSLEGINLSVYQDSGGSGPEGPVITTLSGSGGPGSAVVINSLAIGTVAGSCSGQSAERGPDGQFCTADDPQSSRGEVNALPNVTGTATAKVDNINGGNNDLPMISTNGAPFDCASVSSGVVTGANFAGAFVGLDQPTVQDIEVTTNLAAQ